MSISDQTLEKYEAICKFIQNQDSSLETIVITSVDKIKKHKSDEGVID